jgi:Cell wall-active antibiotics response 4TMS YvqF/Domain of unknown function (DUF1707)
MSSYPGQLPQVNPNARILSSERDRVAQALSLHFAADHIRIERLEELLDLVYQAQTPAQLDSLLEGLPLLSPDALDAGVAQLMAPSSAVPARGVVFAFMGGAARKGSWLVPRMLKVVAVMGGVEIDLREARFSPGTTEIDVTSFMGGVEVIVPRGVRVEVLGAAFMGGFQSDAGDARALDPSQPVLRITGLAIMAGVDIKVRRPSRKTLARFEAAVNLTRDMDIGSHDR